MTCSFSELLVEANRQSTAFGLPPVTPRKLRDLAEARVIPCAKASGNKRGMNPTWKYPDETKRMLRTVFQLESVGARRKAQLRACLWILGYQQDFNLVRTDLRLECDRLISRERWRRNWPKKSGRQLPSADRALSAAGFIISADARSALAKWLYGLDDFKSDFEKMTGLFWQPWLSVILSIIPAGAMGDPDETEKKTALQILNGVSPVDLDLARAGFCLAAGILAAMAIIFETLFGPKNQLALAYGKAANSVFMPEWMIATVGLFAVIAFHFRGNRKPADSK